MVKTTNIDRNGKTRKMKKLLYGPGHDCAFPFKFKGKMYDEDCVNGETGDWCATTKTNNDYTDTWGYCDNQKSKKKSPEGKLSSSSRESSDSPPPPPSSYSPPVIPPPVGVWHARRLSSKSSSSKEPVLHKSPKRSSSKKDSDEIIKKHFDTNSILAKITYEFPRAVVDTNNSLIFGKKKGEKVWMVMEPGVDNPDELHIDDAFEKYMNDREYFNKRYEVTNFEGFDDVIIRQKIRAITFKPVDIKKCNNDKAGFGVGDDFKDIDKDKIIQVSNGNCYDIDELVGYLINQEGKNIDPINSANGLATPLWNNEDELIDIQHFPGIDPEQQKDFNIIMEKALVLLNKPPYIDILNTPKGQEFMDRLMITGKICLEDYTRDGMFKNAATEIARTREYLDVNFSKDEKDKILDITTINGLSLRRWLYGNLGDDDDNTQCVHGLGFKYSSFYFTAFTIIRENCEKLGNKMNLKLFPGIAEIRKDVFIFCHGAEGSNFKNGALYPLTGFIYDTENGTNIQGGTGRIISIRSNSDITPGSELGFNYNFAILQIDFFKQNLKTITGKNTKILLNQFADRPGANKPKSPGKVVNCKKTKKKSSTKSSPKVDPPEEVERKRLTVAEIADLKARGKLPFNGNMQEARNAKDNNAMMILMKAMGIQPKLLSKKTRSKSRSSSSNRSAKRPSSSESIEENIDDDYFGLQLNGKIDKRHLNSNLTLKKNKFKSGLEIESRVIMNVTSVKNRYKISMKTSKTVNGIKNKTGSEKIYWWNPNKGNNGSPQELLQQKIDMGFKRVGFFL
jgi:hypothetical protein